MVFDLVPGEECRVVHNFIEDGEPAFFKGDVVKIEDSHPLDPQRPGFRFKVYSERLERYVYLRGIDLERRSCPKCRDILSDPDRCKSCGWFSTEAEHFKIAEETREFRERLKRSRDRAYRPWWGI